jgi:hypothetical protein
MGNKNMECWWKIEMELVVENKNSQGDYLKASVFWAT